MKFTVVWSRTAQDRLMEIWLNSSDRSGVSAASNRIDVALARDPLRHARSRNDGIYELEVKPLMVLFSFSESDQRVAVEDVMELGPLNP